MKSKTNIRDLSKALGLSISTVSKSLSNSHEISTATKKRVRDHAKMYNYRPNQMAAGFRKGNTKAVGVIIPNLSNPFFNMVLLGIQEKLEPEGYQIITSFSQESSKKESNYVEFMTSGYVDGLILCISLETQRKDTLKYLSVINDQGLPMVLFDRINHKLACDNVISNNFDISSKAVDFLIKKRQCKKIAMVSLNSELPNHEMRIKGYKASIINNHELIENSYYITARDKNILIKKIEQLLHKGLIDSIYGISEEATTCAIQTIKAMGKRIGEDINVIGFSNPSEKKQTPSLVLVNQRAKTMGTKTAQILLHRINQTKKSKFKTTVVKASFV